MKGDGSSRQLTIAKPGYKGRGKAAGGGDKKAARKYDDRKYIERGKFYVLDIDEDMLYDVKEINEGKVGRPFKYSDEAFVAAKIFRAVARVPYRQLKGVFETLVGGGVPSHSVIFERINAIAEKDGEGGTLYLGNGGNTWVEFFAGDSTGLKSTNRGNWMDQKWGGRKGFVKLHVIVDAKTKRIYAIKITTDKEGDMPNLKELLRQALSNAKPAAPSADKQAEPEPKAKVGLDAAYDSKESYRLFDEHGVEGLVPVRRNFSGNANGSTARKEAGFRQLGGFDKIDRDAQQKFAKMTDEQKTANQGAWMQESGYNQRQSVEGSFSTFKRIFGESVMSRNWQNVVNEVMTKAAIYNKMIDMAQERGYLHGTAPAGSGERAEEGYG